MCKIQKADQLPVPKDGDTIIDGVDVERGPWWQLVAPDGSKSAVVYGPKPRKVYTPTKYGSGQVVL